MNLAGERVKRGAFSELRRQGEKVADLARDMAPHLRGDLEQAIQVSEPFNQRDRLGRFARAEVQIFVDPEAESSTGHNVAKYAYLMHEGQEPYGTAYRRGAGTRAKGPKAGGGYMARAFEEYASKVTPAVVARVQQELEDEL